jgi:pimeloyl-ACP methyl ester carboxylesterase
MTGSSAHKSTIVRTNAIAQAALAFTEREAPRLGARLAVRMWMTIPGGASPAQRMAGAGRQRLTDSGVRTVLRAAGRRKRSVVTECWGTGPVVYLLHGWGGHRGQFDAFVDPLTSAGFRVVAVDALGHGESGRGAYGRGRGLLPDFTSALRTAVEHYGPPHGIVAHSLGASAAAVAVLDGLAPGRLVLIAPLASVMSGIDIFARMAGIGPEVRGRMPRRIERLVRMPIGHFDIVTRSAECDELPPTLVIHDTADKAVSFDTGVLVAAAWPGARLWRTDGLGHRRILVDAGVIGTVTEFMTGVAAVSAVDQGAPVSRRA